MAVKFHIIVFTLENAEAISNEVNCLYADSLIEAGEDKVKQNLSQCLKTSLKIFKKKKKGVFFVREGS